MLTVLTLGGAETLTGNAMLLAEHVVCWSTEVWDRSTIKVHTKGREEINSPQLSWPRAPRSQEEKVRPLDTKFLVAFSTLTDSAIAGIFPHALLSFGSG